MKLVDLFRQLSFGELSNLAISKEGSGEIVEEKRPQLVQYVNDGLLALHSRFLLAEKDVLIEQIDSVTFYHLSRKYAVTSNSDAQWHYIKDLPEDPFQEDLIKILSVFDVNTGCKRELNDTGNPVSLFTPQPNILQVPCPVTGEALCVIYQASHSKLDDRIDGPKNLLDQSIDLPAYLKNPLQLYVAHKVFSHMNGQENVAKSQEYLASFETACLEVEDRDLVNQTFHTTHNKFKQRGFV